jgi:alpha-galactosidase
MVFVGCGLLGPQVAGAGPAGRCEYQTCYAQWSESELELGNAHVWRVWKIRNGLLAATSLSDHDAGIEWMACP